VDSRVATRTDLTIDGMTCAACSARIQRRLSRLDGVESAQVNFATGRAVVMHRQSLAVDRFDTEVESLGYRVIDRDAVDQAEKDREANLRRRLVVAAALTLPAMALSMLRGLQFDGWEWLVAALALPVILWCGGGVSRCA